MKFVVEVDEFFVAYSHGDGCWVLMRYGHPEPIYSMVGLQEPDFVDRQKAEVIAKDIVTGYVNDCVLHIGEKP